MTTRKNVRIAAYTGPMRVRNPKTGEVVTFRPTGDIAIVGEADRLQPNPKGELFVGASTSARIIVGLSVKDNPKYDYDDLVEIVQTFLERRGAPVDATFLIQQGIYRSEIDQTSVVREKSSQVLIMNLGWPSDEEFVADMEALSDAILDKLEQEKVYLEIQRGGIPQFVQEFISPEIVAKRRREQD